MFSIQFVTVTLALWLKCSSCSYRKNAPHIFYTESLPDDKRFMPTIGNGHVGFTIGSDTIHMNGVYNGKRGLSHRARIPNYSNLIVTPDPVLGPFHTSYILNVEAGTFQINYESEMTRIVHVIYTHCFFNRAIVNQIFVYRWNTTGALRINIRQEAGHRSNDIDFSEPESVSEEATINADNQQYHGGIVDKDEETPEEVVDAHKHGAISIHNSNDTFHMIKGYTKELEDDDYQKSRKHVCCLWNHVPEEVTLPEDQQFVSLRFIMTLDELCSVAKQEMMDTLKETPSDLLRQHRSQWNDFWNLFEITVEDNLDFAQIIYGSIFYLTSSLPSFKTNQPNNEFYGLSPTGLGRGSTLDDYEGHSFWDTEIWMLPVVAQMDPRWVKLLLNYRFRMLTTAQKHATGSGYHGARFPWESAFTGVEVIQPCCPEVATYELHITADIAFGIRNYFGITHDTAWMESEGCTLVENIAHFWASRVEYDNKTDLYNINHVMGPDEDHADISNNVFTNFVVAKALRFANDIAEICPKSQSLQLNHIHWNDIASKLKILYDTERDYHPQFDGYEFGTSIKQADTILLGYPLLMQMNATTRMNDLEFYENVTRESGPAMTWAMHSINYLDIEEYTRADRDFIRAYRDYVRAPFNVWSEVKPGKRGAVNFLTGASGFLQMLINGYAGVRIYYDCMEIRKPQLLPNTTEFSISGINYLGSRFRLRVNQHKSILSIISIDTDHPLKLYLPTGERDINDTTFIYEFHEKRIFIGPQYRVLQNVECPIHF